MDTTRLRESGTTTQPIAVPAPSASRSLQFSHPLEEQIYNQVVALRAWHLWKKEGCPIGRSEFHWQQAEREVALKIPLTLAKSVDQARQGVDA